MNRISSLLVASALAVLPIGAFAQQNAAPVKTAPPPGMTTTTPAMPAPVIGKTASTTAANVTPPAKTDVKSPAHGAKTEVHGMNGMKSHAAKSNVQHVKAEVPAKS